MIKNSKTSINQRLINIASTSATTASLAPSSLAAPSSSLSSVPSFSSAVPSMQPQSSKPSSTRLQSAPTTTTEPSIQPQSSKSSTLRQLSPTTTTEPTAVRRMKEVTEAEEVVIVVTDSNGKYLNPSLLHDTKKVVIEERATWEMALNQIPKPPIPGNVKDVVLIPGINNVMSQDQQISDILNIADMTGKKYQRAFPNATIHLGSIAPVNEKCLNYNFHLQELATQREAPFITTEEMFDARNGKLKPNILNGMHYTKMGIRPLAIQIKRSLYNRKTKTMLNPQTLRPHFQPHPQPHPDQAHHVKQQLGPNTAMILETFFNIAKACLPQQ